MSDMFDPNSWIEKPVRQLWIGPNAHACTLVDSDLYERITRHLWRICVSGSGMAYVRRGDGLYLHQLIMALRRIMPPSNKHRCIDHISGDTMDNRTENLRWATFSENRTNRGGSFAKQLMINFGDRT